MTSQMSDLISWHLSTSSRTIIGNDLSKFYWVVAQSYANFWQYVVLPILGSPLIKTVRGFSHSSCGLKTAVMLKISFFISPLVLSFPTIRSLVKISFRLKLNSSHQGTGRSRSSWVLCSCRILSITLVGSQISTKRYFFNVEIWHFRY